MKRTAAFFLASVLLLICSGCGLWSDPADEPLIHVFSNEETVAPYEHFRWAQSWSNNGWISADSFYLSGELKELSQSFPTITYSDDFEIRCSSNVTAQDIRVYDSALESIRTNATESFLDTLSPGTYYILIHVRVQGNYVAAGKDYEYTGYDCGYKLIVR